MPGAGDLCDRITFEARGEDANGDPLGPWAPQFTVWAQMVWLRGSEAALQQRLEGRQPVAIVVRTSSQTRGITTAWRAVNARNAEQRFNITAVSAAKEPGLIDVLATMGGATG
ncbi:head-tail adaptor protein [Brevundimonas vesicularis]|uniref:Head-tail adaptor protein n=1 Tax=Brevundimonas vesicularis TaxID=41276 RepID=A0A1Z3U5P5_BREVE|nr:head-tail adaptor protein [Brevundimonas vesicularis]ASE38470.1 head-tail adaptor protein [Brevundimonas vesicularis]